ncbi:MAG: glycerol-3-phosphate acyltransferase [Caldilineaceae bacterium]
MNTFLALLLSYLLGCFCTAYYLVRWRTGQDIRTLGSGTAGAKNAGRILGARGFILAFLGDFGKGLLALWLANRMEVGAWGIAAAMLAVVLGHLYPFQLGGRGGKGVAAGFGAVVGVLPLLGAYLLVVAALCYGITRSFTGSGLITIALAPIVAWLLGAEPAQLVGLTLLTLLLLLAHRTNLRAIFQDGWQAAGGE